MSGLQQVAVDARMIRHSGIGTALRGLLWAWREEPPAFDLSLMGDPEQLPHSGEGRTAVTYGAPLYSLSTALLPAPVGDAQVLLASHYAAPLRPRALPLVAVVHDLIHITHPTKRGTRLFMKAYLAALRRRASFIITPSRHTKVQLQTLHGFDAHRVLTLPWGAGLAGLTDEKEPPTGLLPSRGYMLAVGIYKPHKNWKFLLRRLAGLWAKKELELPLVAAGLDAQGREAIAGYAETLGCSKQVVILPAVEDGVMLSVYRRASALLFPSLIEGFGFPLVEAMACGTPVVAADLPPMNETACGAAFFFDPDLPESFDEAVRRCLEDEEQRELHAAEAKRRAAEHDWKTVAKAFEDVLERAFEGFGS